MISQYNQLKPFYIKDIKIYPPFVMAPLAEITDSYLRPLLKKQGGIGLTVSEMISSDGISRNNPRSIRTITVDPDEHPVALQVYGTNPEKIAITAEIAKNAGADIIDINFGCPAKKIIRNGKGVSLMRNLKLSEEIIRSVRSAVDLPVTVKIRLGWNRQETNYIEFSSMASEAGADAITLHARTGYDGFRGDVIKEAWGKLADVSPIPVIANGDITNTEKAREALYKYGCDGVMIGRAALKNPFIFRIVYNELNGGSFNQINMDYGKFFMDYYQSIQKRDNPSFVMHKLRKMAGWLSHGYQDGIVYRRRISMMKHEEIFVKEFVRFFKTGNPLNQYCCSRTIK